MDTNGLDVLQLPGNYYCQKTMIAITNKYFNILLIKLTMLGIDSVLACFRGRTLFKKKLFELHLCLCIPHIRIVHGHESGVAGLQHLPANATFICILFSLVKSLN